MLRSLRNFFMGALCLNRPRYSSDEEENGKSLSEKAWLWIGLSCA
jgi:hypothetical protein